MFTCNIHGSKAIKSNISIYGSHYDNLCFLCLKWEIFKKLGYKTYHHKVEEFHNSSARVKACWAPSRTTKSYSAAHDILPFFWLDNAIVWIVGPNYDLAEKEFRVVYEQLVLNRDKVGLPEPSSCYSNPRSGAPMITWPNGSRLLCKSADNKTSLLGEAIDAVIYSEGSQLDRSVRERYVMQRCITKKGIEIIPSTPSGGAKWMHELCEMGQKDEYKGLIESFHWDYTANPLYPKEEYNNAKRIYGVDSPMFREQYLGEWVFYGGLVYPMFREDLHVIEPFNIPRSWPVIRGIDFGHRDPFCCLWCAIGPSNELYFYREYYSRESKPMKLHAEFIQKLSVNENIISTVGDPSAAQSIEDLAYYGIPCISGDNDRASGRMLVADYMQPVDGFKPYFIGETERKRWPRLYIFNTLRELTREIKYYRFKEGTAGDKFKEGERETTEGEDHAVDPMRYIVKTRPRPFTIRKKPAWNSFYYFMDINKSKGIVEMGRM